MGWSGVEGRRSSPRIAYGTHSETYGYSHRRYKKLQNQVGGWSVELNITHSKGSYVQFMFIPVGMYGWVANANIEPVPAVYSGWGWPRNEAIVCYRTDTRPFSKMTVLFDCKSIQLNSSQRYDILPLHKYSTNTIQQNHLVFADE